MNLKQANETIVDFFDGKELTFCVERFGDNQEQWVARCDQVPGIVTGGDKYNEKVVKEQVKDAILTAAGVDGKFADKVLRELSFSNSLAVVA